MLVAPAATVKNRPSLGFSAAIKKLWNRYCSMNAVWNVSKMRPYSRQPGSSSGVAPSSSATGRSSARPMTLQNRADAHSRNGQHTEQPVRALLIAHAQRHGDQRTAARADHKAEAAQHLEIGVNEVQRRERRFARAVRDKEAVHNRVDRREDHHDNGRRREFQQPPRGKVIGQLDLV